MNIKIKGDNIILPNRLISKGDIGDLIEALQEIHKICNDATFSEPPVVIPKTTLFDSIQDDTVTTVELTEKHIQDFQELQNDKGGDIRKTLVLLINYYSTHDNLNLILLADALATRQSYIRYTHQLALYLRTHQREYRQVKVQFDPTTTRLGIFCRKDTEASPLSKSFINSIVAMLRVQGSAQVNNSDIPISYLKNHAAVKHLLKFELGEVPKIIWEKDCVKIFLKGSTKS